MRTLVLSTVVMVLALLGGAHVAAQSGDEAAVAQAVEAFRNAMLKADRSQFEALCAALGDDLRRFEEGRPIQARPASALERGRMWVKRRPTAATLLLVSVVLTEPL